MQPVRCHAESAPNGPNLTERHERVLGIKAMDQPAKLMLLPNQMLNGWLGPCRRYKRIEPVLPSLDPLCIVALGRLDRFVAQQPGHFLKGDPLL